MSLIRNAMCAKVLEENPDCCEVHKGEPDDLFSTLIFQDESHRRWFMDQVRKKEIAMADMFNNAFTNETCKS